MNAKKVNQILNSKEKTDVFYNNRPVWIQELNNNIATVGFIDNFEEMDVGVFELYESNF